MKGLSEYVEVSKSIVTLTDDSMDIEGEIGKAGNCLLRALTLVQIGLIKDGFDKTLGGFGDYLELRGKPLNENKTAEVEEFIDNFKEMTNQHQMRLYLIGNYVSEVINCVEYID